MSLKYVPHSATSKEAASSMKSNAENGRTRVLNALRVYGPMSDEELQSLLDMNPSTERPRRIELVEQGLVADSGKKTATRSGRNAVLWMAVE